MKVKVVDALMGFGKSSALINHINESGDDVRFLYVTPFLSEVNRVVEWCPDKNFKAPVKRGTKLEDIKKLFKNKRNIVTTHKLFSMLDEEALALAYNAGYTLVMDEVTSVVDKSDISDSDKKIILQHHAQPDENNILEWYDREYSGRYDDYKRMCDLQCIGMYGDSLLVWLFPISTFKAFKETYLLTYLFDAQMQKYYYDLYGVEYEYLYVVGDDVSNYRLSSIPDLNRKIVDYSKLINICDDDKLNYAGYMNGSLSMSWYKRNRDNSLFDQLKDNLYNFFRNKAKTKSSYNLWTTFNDFEKDLAGKGYAKGFLVHTMRATNAYKDRVSVAYMINKYFDPTIKNFFISKGITVNEDMYALSELLQFLFRSAIREGNPITLYIPSRRMRELLIGWMNTFKIEN
jgi:uncharacterized DUF497 family protein